MDTKLGGGNSNIFYFHPYLLEEMIQFDEHIFQMGWFDHQRENPWHTPPRKTLGWVLHQKLNILRRAAKEFFGGVNLREGNSYLSGLCWSWAKDRNKVGVDHQPATVDHQPATVEYVFNILIRDSSQLFQSFWTGKRNSPLSRVQWTLGSL